MSCATAVPASHRNCPNHKTRRDKHVQQTLRPAIRNVDRKCPLTSRQGAEVRYPPVQPRQTKQAFNEPRSLPKRHPEQMGWLPPSSDGIVMYQDVSLRTTKRRGRRYKRYNDRGGSGKECFSASRCVDDRRGQVSQETDACAIHGVHGRPSGRRGCHGGLRQLQPLGA